jgi:hypothetical protein
MPLRFNPYTGKYEFAEDDMKITYNEFERKYEYGYDHVRETPIQHEDFLQRKGSEVQSLYRRVGNCTRTLGH